jgi:hypothetical protein
MSEIDGVLIAKRVLALSELEDYEGILNVAASSASTKISKDSTPAAMRKMYLKLSLIIHPDKLGKIFPDATKAFQAAVRAFEYLNSPALEEEQKASKKKKVPVISRSNEGCYRTRICCPRCKQPWNEGTLDGNPEYCYNFIMTGLKKYTCSTCLCEFGCLSARHHCPFCNGLFQYFPSNYHTKIICGNRKCGGGRFGFMLYHVSDRALNEVRRQVMDEQQQRDKAREAKLRRAARSQRSALNAEERETEFLFGLRDCCPRCGEDFSDANIDEGQQRQHLMECSDETKHKAYKIAESKIESKKAKKDALAESESAAQTYASWQLLGSNPSQLWILDDSHLRGEASRLHIDETGSREELISRISLKRRRDAEGDAVALLEDGPAVSTTTVAVAAKLSSSSSSTALIRRDTSNKRDKASKDSKPAHTLPANLHRMSLEQLRSLCAAEGWLSSIASDATKSDVLEFLEQQYYEERSEK